MRLVGDGGPTDWYAAGFVFVVVVCTAVVVLGKAGVFG